MKLSESLLQDLADATELARRTSDPVRMRAAGDWLKVIGAQILEEIAAATAAEVAKS